MTGAHTAEALFAGHRFRIVTDPAFAPDQNTYLRAFVPEQQFLAPVCGEETSVRIRLDADLLAEQCARLAAAPSVTVVPFRAEPYRTCRLGETTWWRPCPDSCLPQDHLLARDAAGRLTVLLRPGAERGERYLMRAVRETVMRCAEDRGWSVFHAAAAALGDRGVLIAAPSGAGKTTVLTALAAHQGADMVASDRALVDAAGHQVAGVPLSVRIGGGTLAAVPAAQRGPASGTVPEVFGSPRKAALTPREFASAFGCRLLESAPLTLVVVPRLLDDDTGLQVRLLDQRRARARLAAACCTPHDEDWLEPFLARRARTEDDLAHGARTLLEHMAATMPVLEVTAGVHQPSLPARIADTVAGRLR